MYADVTSVSRAFQGKKMLTPAISNNSISFKLGYHQRICEKIAAQLRRILSAKISLDAFMLETLKLPKTLKSSRDDFNVKNKNGIILDVKVLSRRL